MTDTGSTNRLDKLKALRMSYHDNLPRRMMEIESSWLSLLAGNVSSDVRHVFHRLVHSLAGSAGTFGYDEISQKARQLEHVIQRMIENNLSLSDDLVVQVATNLTELKQIANSDANTVKSLTTNTESMNEVTAKATTLFSEESSSTSRLIFVVEDDDAIAEEIAVQLNIFGWEIRTFTTIQDVYKALQIDTPAAVIADIMLSEGGLAGAEFIRDLKHNAQQIKLPTIVISSRWDWDSRLAAVRAGVDAYYVKPIDFSALAERLDVLVYPPTDEPFRVLIVEDEDILAAHYAEVLTQANMYVRTALDPADVLETLNDFEPELLLLDLYMPSCNGTEMAQVIRQDNKFNDLPIVFLSTESGRQLQLAAMQSGADDFLQKPITNNELIAAVTIRAARFRALRQLIRQDSMTGLLNHIALKLQLEIEISRHQRSGEVLSVVMLDIDKFKSVNDLYGHPMGDRVIKSLAQLLRKRLRKTDIIGRYGGEEFAVVMASTKQEEAVSVMNKIREQFAKIRHANGEQECICTFSAGVSAFPAFTTVSTLIEASDTALYQAKFQGRNQVCVQNPEAKD